MCCRIIPFILLCLSGFTSGAQRARIDSLLHVDQARLHDTSKIKLFTSLAVEFGSRNIDSSFLFSREILKISEKLIQDSKPGTDLWLAAELGFGKAFQMIGYNFSSRDRHILALIYYQKAMNAWDLAEKWAPESMQASLLPKRSNTLVSIGRVYINQGDYARALDYNLQALKVSEKSGSKKSLVVSYGNLGLVYKLKKDYDKTLAYYDKALKLAREIGDREKTAAILGNTGNVYVEQKKYAEALDCFLKALETGLAIGDREKITVMQGDIGNAYKGLHEFGKARSYYLKGIQYSRDMGDQMSMARNYGNLGILDIESGNYPKAEENLNKALVICREFNAREELESFEKAISDLYSKTGKHRLASEHYLRSVAIRDSMFKEQNDREATRLEMSYDFGKREAAILAEMDRKNIMAKAEIENQVLIRNTFAGGVVILLLAALFSFVSYRRKRETLLKQREAEFRSRLAEFEMKALRAQINPHFIFNCLNAVQRYILKNDRDHAADYLQKFATLMRLILSNSEKEKVILHDELTMLEYYIQLEALRFDTGFDYEIRVDKTIVADTEEVPSMILQPFIENAIWHGLMHKSGKGKITVEVRRENNVIKCVIEDNGIGRQKAAEIKLSQPKAHPSKGLDITNARIELMNLKQNIRNSIRIFDLLDPDNLPLGTRVELLFQAA